MSTASPRTESTATDPTSSTPRSDRGSRPSSAARSEAISGWLFVAPTIVILGLFLLVPVGMALWVSVSDWNGRGSPFGPSVSFVGLQNYDDLVNGDGLATRDFGISLRNNAWYVLWVVPLQTALSLFLAVLVNKQVLRGRGFFRTAFYFPSVTSSVAITVVWLFLFTQSGAVNKVLSFVGVQGPAWFQDPSGVVHNALGMVGVRDPAFLTEHQLLGVTWWDWLAGPSVAMSAFVMMAVFTTSGTFMLLFIAALQNLGADVEEAAMVDGASPWQRFWKITVPQLRPTLFTVLTLGLIGTWQVFDQIYTGTQGGPAKTTLTPSYLSYTSAFAGQEWGRGAAIAFVLFAIIVSLTILQRIILRDRSDSPRRSSTRRTLTSKGQGR